MEYLKAHVTVRVPVDAAFEGGPLAARLGGRLIEAEVNGAELLGAVDGVWLDTRPDGGRTLVLELDLHTAIRVDGAGELLRLAFPDDAPPGVAGAPLSWTCMVCGRQRPDAAITVTHRRLATLPDAFPDTRVNVRHCNDDPSCISLAAVAPRWGAAPVVSGPPQLESWVDGPCAFLTCTAERPHAHPVCRSCGAVRYGNLFCGECQVSRPAMEQREAELGWFPAHVREPSDVKAHLLAPRPQGHGASRAGEDAERFHAGIHQAERQVDAALERGVQC